MVLIYGQGVKDVIGHNFIIIIYLQIQLIIFANKRFSTLFYCIHLFGKSGNSVL